MKAMKIKVNLNDVKVGDTVYRYLSTIPTPMILKVSSITEEKICCGPWEFSKVTGGEIDEYLSWDGVNTGSFITEKPK